MRQLKMCLVVETKELWDEVRNCVRETPVQVLLDKAEITDRREFKDWLERARPDVVLLDVTRDRIPLDQLVPEIKAASGGAAVIALHTVLDNGSLLAAMRAGVDEYIVPPVQERLHNALKAQLSARRRNAADGKICAFLSVKGGCGATTIACHTAVEIGKRLARPGQQRALLADVNLNGGMIQFLLRLPPLYSIADAIANLHRLDATYWKALVSDKYAGLDVITAPPGFTPRLPPDGSQLSQLFDFLRSQYPCVIADLGRGLNRAALESLERVDEIYLVTAPDVSALWQAGNLARVLAEHGCAGGSVRLVLNRMWTDAPGAYERVEKITGLPVFAAIPNDYTRLYEAYSHGRLATGGGRFMKQISELASALSGTHEPESRMRFQVFASRTERPARV